MNEDGSVDIAYRGKEIFDPTTDNWYWLDNIQSGAKATSKDVYQESIADDAGAIGKWVRYDLNGCMIKGWNDLNGDRYYFDMKYGTMAKGIVTIDNVTYYFDQQSGKLLGEMTEKHIVTNSSENFTNDTITDKETNFDNILHTHTWEDVVEEAYIVDSPQYDEIVWIGRVRCNICKKEFEDTEEIDCVDAWAAHSRLSMGKWVDGLISIDEVCGSYTSTTYKKKIHHEEVGHYETKVIGRKCSECQKVEYFENE